MNKSAVATAAALAVTVAVVSGLSAKDLDKEKTDEPKIVTECAKGPRTECDALETKNKKAQYRRAQVDSEDCVKYRIASDGGTEAIGRWRNVHGQADVTLINGSCNGAVVADDAQDAGLTFVELACACRKAKGDCRIPVDGGSFQAPMGQTLGPGYSGREAFAGKGCQEKSCTELLGQTSWPVECPR